MATILRCVPAAHAVVTTSPVVNGGGVDLDGGWALRAFVPGRTFAAEIPSATSDTNGSQERPEDFATCDAALAVDEDTATLILGNPPPVRRVCW